MPGPEVHTVHKARHLPFIAIAIVVVLAVAAVVLVKFIPHPSNTTSTTTVPISLNRITGCGSIGSPGTYSLYSNITTRQLSGACINVTASNVNLECGGHRIIGSGPYEGVPPFSTGILISGSAVGVHGCTVSNFSYGVFAQPASGLNISNDNISSNYMSNIYFSGVRNSTISGDRLYRATSNQSAIHLANGSSDNLVLNNTLLYNLHNGIFINSTGNLFSNNYINGSPMSYYCTPYGGIRKNNNALGGLCYNNTGCSFAYCKGYNIPTNLSALALANPVSGCGSINHPGAYSLRGSINMDDYVNVSAILGSAYPVACLYISSDNVLLNCNGNSITNATTAIVASGLSNVTIENCRISTASTGISFRNMSDSHIDNTSVGSSLIGVLLSSSNVDFITNSTTDRNVYGILFTNSTTDTINRFSSSNNEYGLYLEDSLGNIFNDGSLLNNTQVDVYASVNSANSTYNLMTATSCGVTNAAWAPCASHITPSLLFYPITSCTDISRAGNYSLTTSILTSSQSCISITSSNVRLECHGNGITSSGRQAPGSAIMISNASNVTVSGCGISDFNYGVNATRSSAVSISNVSDNTAVDGISLTGVRNATLSNSIVKGASGYSIGLLGTSGSTVRGNNVSYGTGSSTGIYLNSSGRNLVYGNRVSSNYFGMDVQGLSQNNTIYNNTMSLSGRYDYVCGLPDSQINSEQGGINYDTSKSGCYWMAVLNPSSTLPCTSTFAPEDFSLQSDAVYRSGATCFSVYGNGTTLNCNGHTIISTSGGTLMDVKNARSVTLENCFVKGFAQPFTARNSTVSVLNNTIYLNGTAPQNGSAVNLSIVSNINVAYNNITAPRYGLYINSGQYGAVSYNRIEAGTAAYYMSNVSGMSIKHNVAYKGSGIGLLLNDSITSVFESDNFSGITLGLQCTGTSQPSFADSDLGGNLCSSQASCAWISKSNSTC